MAARDELERAVLPMPDQRPARFIAYDAKDPEAKFPPIKLLRPPAGAANVLVVPLDDVAEVLTD
jgi:arylsulfatase